jgi:flagellar hook-associated protein 2
MATTSATSSTQGSTQALMSAAGSTTGIDVNSLVTQLVAADKAVPQQQLTDRQTAVNTEISALAAFKAAVGVFQSAVQRLSAPGSFAPRAATSSIQNIVTATAASTAATGSYSIEVDALASANQLASAAYPGGASTVAGTGTLSITSGTNNFSVTIGAPTNTLQDVADAINSAPGNTSVQASILNEAGGSHLVLTASQTGAANAVQVAETDGGTGLSSFVYDPNGTQNLTVLQPAGDAHIKVAGFDHYSPTNVVSDAVSGLTLNLQAAAVGTKVSVTVANDNSTLLANAQSFVAAYNNMVTQVQQLSSYDASTQTAGPLFGDAVVRVTLSSIGDDVTSAVSGLSGTYTSLASIGITSQTDGTLALDQTKFNAALSAAPGSVAAVFSSANGVIARSSTNLDSVLQSGSAIASRSQQLQQNLTQIQDDQNALDARMTALQNQYTSQFTALNTLLVQTQQISSYLTQALANLPKPNATSRSSG